MEIETCDYQTGPDVTRYRYELDIRVVEARTAAPVPALRGLEGSVVRGSDPRECAFEEPLHLEELEGSPVQLSALLDRLNAYVKDESFALREGEERSVEGTGVDIPDHTAPVEGMTLGEADAPITIYEYSDFQCPYCERAAADIVPRLDTEYLATGKAKLIFKNFAFLGDESTWAAEASACASEQGKFWEYHNKLFENQKGENNGAYNLDSLMRFAGEIGLRVGDFLACFDAGKYSGQIADEISEAERSGVNATPTFFVGQTQVETDYDAISEAIEEALAKQGARGPGG